MSEGLDALIRQGISIYAARAEAERKRREEDAAHEDLIRHEVRTQILALLPQATWDILDLTVVTPTRADATLRLPHGGEVRIHFEKREDKWHIYSPDDYPYPSNGELYDAINPKGYYRFFATLEEALAYAAGAIDPE